MLPSSCLCSADRLMGAANGYRVASGYRVAIPISRKKLHPRTGTGRAPESPGGNLVYILVNNIHKARCGT